MSSAQTQPDLTPPPIAPVPAGTPRPRWSVMIPTFNCANYLRLTLQSVLAQAPGPEQMQIEVVDDCSTKDDPEAVVREVGQGRVQFYRKPQNGGAIANFNTCIERSRGELVHILHGDDLVLPGFYEKIGAAAAARPEFALYACRCFFVDEAGMIAEVSPRVPALEAGGRCPELFFYGTPLQTPSVVVRRSFYEQHGGFLLPLVHTADAEMWSRAVARGGGLQLPDVLCQYRVFAANDSGRLARTAENLRDVIRQNELFARLYPAFDQRRALIRLTHLARTQLERFQRVGDAEAVAANRAFWKKCIPLRFRLRSGIAAFLRRLGG
ncbi:MAG: glycosyltransferase family 2 protein [Limisphaerales bacterium]